MPENLKKCVKNILLQWKKTIFANELLTKHYPMKKIFTLVFAILFGFGLQAQTSLTEAVDFTATECYGLEEIRLFDILDRGQHVLIDFYFYQCTPCHTVAPYVEEAYKMFGCNKHDVFFMAVSPDDADFLCQYYAEKYGMEYPVIGKPGGGKEIQMNYDIHSYPTFVLIAPDRKILLQDLDYESIKTIGTPYIIEQLEQFGIEQHNCDEDPGVGSEEISLNDFNIYPNPADNTVKISSDFDADAQIIINDMTGRLVKVVNASNLSDLTIDVSDINKGVYFVNIEGEIQRLIIK